MHIHYGSGLINLALKLLAGKVKRRDAETQKRRNAETQKPNVHLVQTFVNFVVKN